MEKFSSIFGAIVIVVGAAVYCLTPPTSNAYLWFYAIGGILMVAGGVSSVKK